MQAIAKTTIQEITIDAPVSKVTLLEDRALIQRRGKINLTAGLWRVKVDKVAPVISDKSLRAELSGDGARVNDVRVRRHILEKKSQRPEEIQELEAELRSLKTQLEQKEKDGEHKQYCFDQVNRILAKGLQELPVDAVWGQLDQKSWREQFQTLFSQLRELRGEILNSYHTQRELREKMEALTGRMKAISRPDMVYSAYIEADLEVNTGGECAIDFDYVVPNALWRPWHQARLQLGSKDSPNALSRLWQQATHQPANQSPHATFSFRCDGCVWQRTGEDWNDVELVFSTARASLGTEPPLLQDDRLNVKEKSKAIVIQMREQKMQTTGLGAGAEPGTVELPGVDDGGEVRNLRPATKATIPSDGRPYRVPLFAFDTTAEVEYVLMPEVSRQVILKSIQTNSSQFPILAGPVDLVRSTEFVGKTSVMFIAPGEKFALGWGPDGAMRVQRTEEEKRAEDRQTKWNLVRIFRKLFLSNIGAEARTIKITERVPVSELEQVKVKVLAEKTTDEVQPDERGFCTWDCTLEPYSQSQISLVFQVEAAPEVRGI
ncbi:MAG: mucoidy inhibitor MuiA family protein [Hormoscilla sp.]